MSTMMCYIISHRLVKNNHYNILLYWTTNALVNGVLSTGERRTDKIQERSEQMREIEWIDATARKAAQVNIVDPHGPWRLVHHQW